MIKKIVMRNFKRFKEETLELDSPIVFAGPNNSGKTSVIQAISTWHFALQKWLVSGKKQNSIGLPRTEFATAPVSEFNQLWTNKSTGRKKTEDGGPLGAARPLEIEIFGEDQAENGKSKEWSLAMIFTYRNQDQVYAKPTVTKNEIPKSAKDMGIIHIPSFSGIQLAETIYTREYQDILIGQGKPGDILRNMLKEVSENKESWQSLCRHVKDIFNYELLPPKYKGQAFITCEYQQLAVVGNSSMPKLEINTAGSGFQQVLLLLAFLYARSGAVFLIDEPDAHLHIYLQGEIYRLLKRIATEQKGQLIIATHSEVFINATDPENILSFFGDSPHRLSDTHDRKKLQAAIERLSSLDLMEVEKSGGVMLCVEGQSDFNILREWAKILGHSLAKWFEGKWQVNTPDGESQEVKPYCFNMAGKRPKVAEQHIQALQAVYPKMKCFILLDSDGRQGGDSTTAGENPAIMEKHWQKYEIESYLIVPDVINRFVSRKENSSFSGSDAIDKMKSHIPPAYYDDIATNDYLERVKASDDILAKVFEGIPIGKSDYYQIAAEMKPEEIHQDVRDMLDAIAQHFGVS